MSELEIIQTTLQRAAARRRWERTWQGFWKGTLAGGIIWLASVVLYKLAPIPAAWTFYAGGLALLAILVGAIWGWLHKPTLRQTARWVDTQQQLQERLSTALEVANDGKDEGWRSLLLADAARAASSVDPKKLAPIFLPAASRWALVVLTLGAGLGFVPEYRTKAFLEKKEDAQAIKEVGKKVFELTKESLERRPPALEPTRKALESVEQLGLQLSQNPLTRAEAMAKVVSATEKLQSELKQISPQAVKAMERAARSPGQGGPQGDSELQKRVDSLAQSLGKANNPDALAKLKNNLQEARQAAASMPDAGSAAGAAARAQLAQKLSDLSQDAKNLGQDLPGLDEAIAAFQANKIDDFVKDMEAATADLEKLQDMANQLQQLQQQQNPGKDLPEQLQFAQTDTAQDTIKKMMAQLQNNDLSPDKLNQMMDEVSRSIDPASPFGKAAEHFKDAAKEMKKGDKSGARASLAKAAEELAKANEQLMDAKAIAGSLDALNKAQTALASHSKWGQCARCGSCTNGCRPGYCMSGKVGKNGGVGAWSDGSLYPEYSDSWNNNGVQRPDSDPRGHTDRGEPTLADNLGATKLKGQLSPGGQMPSITLKGVSIKGQSAVEYRESAAAAQSAAQSALNQDQVPRAYQGAVRDYFDDLKK
jgi:uncharacterized protein with von Willebrand factor type A (vWA) domain